jgi:hypothetical protein
MMEHAWMKEWKPQFTSMSSTTTAPPGLKTLQAHSSSKHVLYAVCKLSWTKRSICPREASNWGGVADSIL